MIWNCCPKRSVKRVASGRAVGFQAVPPVARRQASIALATEGVADQIRRVSRRHCNRVGNGRGRDLRRGVGDRAEGTCEHESGREQAPSSRILTGLLMELAHFFVLHFLCNFKGYKRLRLVGRTTSSKAFAAFVRINCFM